MLRDVPLTDGRTIGVDVYYRKGIMEVGHGRGIRLSMSVCSFEECGPHTVRLTSLGRGLVLLVEQTPRDNQRITRKWCDLIGGQIDARSGEWWDKVCEFAQSRGLTIAAAADPLEQVAAELDALTF